jgi:transcriptional regulator NrdR family protein
VTTSDKLYANSRVHCPHCNQEQEDPVQDFVVPARIGPASRRIAECGWCSERFSIERNPDTSFTISKQ